MSAARHHNLDWPYLNWPGPIAFAHRGGAREVPENTMRAFRHAVDLGYRYLETDVQSTADGALLVFHDDDLQRTCDRPGIVGELRRSDLASVRVGGSEPIPTFDELLEEWPDARLNVDCKTDAAAAPLVTAVRRHDVFERVCVAAFDHRRLQMLRRLGGPMLCTSSSSREIALLWGAGKRPGGVAAQVPPRRGRIRVVTDRFVRRAHRHGVAVHVWTIDDRAEMHRLLDAGADGIMTDRPTVLRDVLIERGSWVA